MDLKHLKKFYEKNEKKILPLCFVVFFVLFGLYVFVFSRPADTSSKALESGCVLEYGEGECINGRLVVPFLNNGTETVDSVKLEINVTSGLETFNVPAALLPGKTGTLQLSECDKILSWEEIMLEYCCGECFNTKLDSPTAGFTIFEG